MANTTPSINLQTARESIRRALAEPVPFDALWALAKQFRDENMSQSVMYDLLTEFHLDHREEHDETRSNAISDVLDFVVGWCTADNRLFPEPLS
jgi:hypothetical protein